MSNSSFFDIWPKFKTIYLLGKPHKNNQRNKRCLGPSERANLSTRCAYAPYFFCTIFMSKLVISSLLSLFFCQIQFIIWFPFIWNTINDKKRFTQIFHSFANFFNTIKIEGNLLLLDFALSWEFISSIKKYWFSNFCFFIFFFILMIPVIRRKTTQLTLTCNVIRQAKKQQKKARCNQYFTLSLPISYALPSGSSDSAFTLRGANTRVTQICTISRNKLEYFRTDFNLSK